MAKEQLDWNTLDIETLTPEQRKIYDAMVAAREGFERMIEQSVKSSCVFSYKRGQIGFALIQKRAAAKGKVSLAEFMRTQREQGGKL